MKFVDGFVALYGAIVNGLPVELTGPNYQRQPVSFEIMQPWWSGQGAARALTPRAVNATGFSFGGGVGNAGAAMLGRAVYDAATGGNCLLILPFGAARPIPAAGPADNVQPGDIVLEGPDITPQYSGAITPGFALGTVYDPADVTMIRSPNPGETAGPAGNVIVANKSPLTAGVGLVVNRGCLQSAASYALI